jgi:hypothetical protein
MAKRKRARKSAKYSTTKKDPNTSPQSSNNELVVAQKIAKIETLITCSALIPATIVFFEGPGIVERAGRLMLVSLFIIFASIFLSWRLNPSGRRLLTSPTPYSTDPKEARRIGVRQLTLAIFVNVAGWMPILYVKDVIGSIANLLPGKEQLGDKLALVTAFGVGAIISGVLGNAAYDLLKFVIRKMVKSKEVENKHNE